MCKIASRRTGNRRLQKLADFIEKVPRERFDLSIIAKTNTNGQLPTPKTCGTAGCAMGFTPCVFPKDIRYKRLYNTPNLDVIDNDGCSNFDLAERFFGLTIDEASYLFLPDFYPKNRRGRVSVANRIRSFTKKRPTLKEMEKEYY